MKYAYIVIDTDDHVKVVPCEDYHLSLDDLYKATESMCIDIVHTCAQYSGSDVLMVVDDIGKMQHKPINLIASWLYCNPNDCIVGNVLIGCSYSPNSNDEPDIFAFPLKDAEKIAKRLVI